MPLSQILLLLHAHDVIILLDRFPISGKCSLTRGKSGRAGSGQCSKCVTGLVKARAREGGSLILYHRIIDRYIMAVTIDDMKQ